MVEKKWRIFTSLVVAPLGFYYVFSNVSFGMVLSNIAGSNLFYLAASYLFLFLVYVFMSLRWVSVLDEKGVDISLGDSVRYLLISLFVNLFIPFRAGDVYRGHISADNKNIMESTLLIFKDRLFDLFVLVSLTLLLALFFFERFLMTFSVVSLVFLSMVAGMYFVFRVEEFPFFTDHYMKLRKVFVRTMNTDRKLYLVFLTVIIWVLGALRTLMVFDALGVEIGFVMACFIAFAWSLSSAIPLTPSGIGSTEAIVFAFLTGLGVSEASVGSFVILNRFLVISPPLFIGGFLYLWENLRDLFPV